MKHLVALCALFGALAGSASAVAPGKPGSIVFAGGDALGRGSTLELIDSAGNGVAHALTQRSLDAAMPAVSPDGTRVAFASLRRGNGGIFVMTLATRAVTRVTAASGDLDPVWSPDGQRLAFARRRATGGHQLMLVAASGGAATAVPHALGRRPDFAPDGKQLVYQRDGASTGLAVTTLDGATATTLGTGAQPSWSPDGTLIAFSQRVSRLDHVLLVHPDGSGRRDITRFAPESDPAWSPDGTHLVVVALSAAGTCCGLATVDPNGGGRIVITHGLPLASNPAWLPLATP